MMIAAALIPVVLVAVIAAGVTAGRRRPLTGSVPTSVPASATGVAGSPHDRPFDRPVARHHHPRDVDPQLGIQLDRWVAAGLLTPLEADEIAEHERRTHPIPTRAPAISGRLPAPGTGRRIPVVAEALGYIGGILGTVGLVLLVARSWDDLVTAARLGLAGGAAIALVIAGWTVHEAADPAFARLRWTLWLASTAATGLFAGVLADRTLGLEHDERIALTVATAVAFESAVLWWNRPRPVQHVTMLGGFVVATALFVQEFAGDVATGATLWVLGGALTILGMRRLTTLPIITLAAGAITTVVGTIVIATGREGLGFPLVCLDAAVLVGIAVTPAARRLPAERIVLAVVGAFGLLQGVPPTIAWFAADAGIATGLTVWGIGVALVAMAARRHIQAAVAIEVLGSIAVIGGAAITGIQSAGFATLFGVATSVGFVIAGMLPGRVLMSLFGSAGLLVFVPWTIAHYFPGEDRAPLLILVSGALLVAIAVLLTRQGTRFRRELGSDRSSDAPDAPDAPAASDAPLCQMLAVSTSMPKNIRPSVSYSRGDTIRCCVATWASRRQRCSGLVSNTDVPPASVYTTSVACAADCAA